MTRLPDHSVWQPAELNAVQILKTKAKEHNRLLAEGPVMYGFLTSCCRKVEGSVADMVVLRHQTQHINVRSIFWPGCFSHLCIQ